MFFRTQTETDRENVGLTSVSNSRAVNALRVLGRGLGFSLFLETVVVHNGSDLRSRDRRASYIKCAFTYALTSKHLQPLRSPYRSVPLDWFPPFLHVAPTNNSTVDLFCGGRRERLDRLEREIATRPDCRVTATSENQKENERGKRERNLSIEAEAELTQKSAWAAVLVRCVLSDVSSAAELGMPQLQFAIAYGHLSLVRHGSWRHTYR